jgi:hypothetical protein
MTVNRPKQVAEFFAYHRQLDRRPGMGNIQEYANSWEAWHKELKTKEDYEDMVKGGGNGVFILILTLRWWMDTSDSLEEGDLKDWSNDRIQVVLKGLNESMAGTLGSAALQRAIQMPESDGDDSGLGIHPKKK